MAQMFNSSRTEKTLMGGNVWKEGTEPWNAIVDPTVRRSRPVVLTAAAAVLSMISLSHSIFWGPMAIAIMGGLVAATGLTLAFVPSVYAAWFKVSKNGIGS